MENKLTIEQLKNYLGTGLRINRIWINAYGGFDRQELDVTVLYHCRLDQIVPHCYRLSDLDKFIPELGFVPNKWFLDNREQFDLLEEDARKLISIVNHVFDTPLKAPYWFVEKLFQWHFWPFGDEYFEQGLVIDKLKYGN